MKLKADLTSFILAATIHSSLMFGGCNSVPRESEMVRRQENLIAPSSFNLEEAVAADELLINFPNKIPGAESIKKYLIPDAKKVLVHIRQTHLPFNPSLKSLSEVSETQKNIYQILSFLVHNYGIREVYDESLTPFYAARKNLCARISYSFNNSVDIEKVWVEKWIEKIAEHLQGLKEENFDLHEDYLYYELEKNYDAVYRVATESKDFEILGAEDSKTIEIAKKMYHSLQGLGEVRWITQRKKAYNTIFEDRENYVLKEASERKSEKGNIEDSWAIVVFGSHHAWGGKKSCGSSYSSWGRKSACDNIHKWNFENPDEKFSLIEIAPFGL